MPREFVEQCYALLKMRFDGGVIVVLIVALIPPVFVIQLPSNMLPASRLEGVANAKEEAQTLSIWALSSCARFCLPVTRCPTA